MHAANLFTSSMRRTALAIIALGATTTVLGLSITSSKATSWLSQFRFVLDEMHTATSFAASGTLRGKVPRVDVDGVGRLDFPIVENSVTLEALKIVAEREPCESFGLRLGYPQQTRLPNSWDIRAAKNVKVNDDPFSCVFLPMESGVLKRICSELGIPFIRQYRLEAVKYKLIVTQAGGCTHRDIPLGYDCHGHIATVVLQLPSQFSNGSLTVRNKDKSETFDLATSSADRLKYVAYFADCDFEFQSPSSGVRVCLVYNIIAYGLYNYGKDPESFIAATQPGRSFWLQALKKWDKTLPSMVKQWESESSGPGRLGYLLDHDYFDQCFGISFLKGRDRLLYQELSEAKGFDDKPLFDVFLVLLEANEGLGDDPEANEADDDHSAWQFKSSVALDKRGSTVTLVFNRFGGGTTSDGTFRVDDSGWLMDSASAVSTGSIRSSDVAKDVTALAAGGHGTIGATAPFSKSRVPFYDVDGRTRGTYYQRAAIFISPAARK